MSGGVSVEKNGKSGDEYNSDLSRGGSAEKTNGSTIKDFWQGKSNGLRWSFR
jgi:hypothetical protein